MVTTATNQLKTFFGWHPTVQYRRHTVLVRETDIPSGVMYLEAGVVAMQTTTEVGNLHTLHLFKPGSFFPLTWALNETPNEYQFLALTEVTVRIAPVKQVKDWLKTQPLVLFDTNRRLLSALSGVVHQVTALMSGSAQTKVTQVLQMLALRFGSAQPDGTTLIQLKLSHQDLALLCGSSRETVTREINKLTESGRVKIQDKQYLIRL